MFLKAVGPVQVLSENLRRINGIEQAFIFGSWARRYHGETGVAPSDVDVFVVGDPEPNLVDEACRRGAQAANGNQSRHRTPQGLGVAAFRLREAVKAGPGGAPIG